MKQIDEVAKENSTKNEPIYGLTPITGFSEGFDEILPIDVIEKNSVAAVTATHEVVKGTGILNAKLSGHVDVLLPRGKMGKEKVNQSRV